MTMPWFCLVGYPIPYPILFCFVGACVSDHSSRRKLVLLLSCHVSSILVFLFLSCLVFYRVVSCCRVLSRVVVSCCVLFCLVLSCLLSLVSCLALSYLVLSCRVLLCLVLSCLVLSCLVLSCLFLSLVLSCLVLSFYCSHLIPTDLILGRIPDLFL
jgi:hypothetical protein